MTMETGDIWHVKLENGEVRKLTLDELDAAYKDGWVRGRTPVLQAGAFRWAPLREIAGLDASGPYDAVPASVAPAAIDVGASLATDEIPAALRPKKRGKTVFAVLVALAVVSGIAFAATRAKPGLVASAKSFVTSHMPGHSGAAAAAAAPVTVEAPKPVEAAPPPPATQAAAQAPLPPPPATQAAAPVATMNVGALPKAKGRRK